MLSRALSLLLDPFDAIDAPAPKGALRQGAIYWTVVEIAQGWSLERALAYRRDVLEGALGADGIRRLPQLFQLLDAGTVGFVALYLLVVAVCSVLAAYTTHLAATRILGGRASPLALGAGLGWLRTLSAVSILGQILARYFRVAFFFLPLFWCLTVALRAPLAARLVQRAYDLDRARAYTAAVTYPYAVLAGVVLVVTSVLSPWIA